MEIQFSEDKKNKLSTLPRFLCQVWGFQTFSSRFVSGGACRTEITFPSCVMGGFFLITHLVSDLGHVYGDLLSMR